MAGPDKPILPRFGEVWPKRRVAREYYDPRPFGSAWPEAITGCRPRPPMVGAPGGIIGFITLGEGGQ